MSTRTTHGVRWNARQKTFTGGFRTLKCAQLNKCVRALDKIMPHVYATCHVGENENDAEYVIWSYRRNAVLRAMQKLF